MLSKLFHNNTKSKKIIDENRRVPNFPDFTKRKKVYSHTTYNMDKYIDEIEGSLAQSLNSRQSSNVFDVRVPITIETLANLLFYSYGINTNDNEMHLSSVPSAGGRYPIYLYIFIFNIDNLEPGIYLWQPETNQLSMMFKGDYRESLIDCIVLTDNKHDVNKCSFAIVTTALLSNTLLKYGDRGYRYILMDAGHVSQNLYLICNSLTLSCRALGGFYDDKLANLIGLDTNDQIVLLTHLFGKEHQSIKKQLGTDNTNYINTI